MAIEAYCVKCKAKKIMKDPLRRHEEQQRSYHEGQVP